MSRSNRLLLLLFLPAGIVFAAFFLVPLGQLFVIGGTGKQGWAAYGAILTNRNYFNSLVATTLLSASVTAATLAISGIAGVFLTRNRFWGRVGVVAMLTFPLAFPAWSSASW